MGQWLELKHERLAKCVFGLGAQCTVAIFYANTEFLVFVIARLVRDDHVVLNAAELGGPAIGYDWQLVNIQESSNTMAGAFLNKTKIIA
jgi:hypothetical protein